RGRRARGDGQSCAGTSRPATAAWWSCWRTRSWRATSGSGRPTVRATVRAPHRLEGEVRLPGDKSISHRALILNAVADGPARVRRLSPGADLSSTAGCLRALGVEIEGEQVVGRGLHGLLEPAGPLDCGNSGTTMRLLAGLLAA